MRKKYFLSTPIYYANDKPHVGHLYSTLIADIWKKVCLLQDKDAFFLTGLDEHGQKVAQSAQIRGLSAQEHVDYLSEEFLKFFHSFGIREDFWIRTTSVKHQEAVQHFWSKLESSGYIYKSKYAGWYSISDETYLQDVSKAAGEIESDANIVWREEECYYFRLSAFQERLEKHFEEHKDFIYPQKRYNEAISFLKNGLKDFVISRPKDRLYWGIEVPNDSEHVIYVWIDALVNYISAIGYPDPEYKNYWPGIHVLGKDILKFHAIYWPALLMGADVALPKRMIVHGWWLKNDVKISKSLGNAVDLKELVEKYKVDGLRYFLIKTVAIGEDGSFREELIKQSFETELANKFGNIFLRILGLIEFALDSHINITVSYQNDVIEGYVEKVKTLFEQIVESPERVTDYAQAFMECVEYLNQFFQEQKIWDIQDKSQKSAILYFLMDVFKRLSVLIYPIMPGAATAILDFLNVEISMKSYDVALSRSFAGSRPILFPKTPQEKVE